MTTSENICIHNTQVGAARLLCEGRGRYGRKLKYICLQFSSWIICSPNLSRVGNENKKKSQKCTRWNRKQIRFLKKKTTVRARKVLIIQLFFVHPMSIQIHFSKHSNYCLTAVLNSSAVMVVVTSTKISVRLSGSGPSAPPSPSRTRRN